MSGATTADITFRIDDENVDNMVIRRGESIEFDVASSRARTAHI